MKLPFGKSEILGPRQTKQFVLPYCFSGPALRGVVPVSHIPHIFYSVCLTGEGRVRTQIFNASEKAYRFGPKTAVGAALCTADFVLLLEDQIRVTEATAELTSWESQFPDVFRFDEPCDQAKTQRFTVQSQECSWRVPMDRIPRHNRGLQYNSGELSRDEIRCHMEHLAARKLIRPIESGEPAFYSPVMFLRKPNGKIRVVQDFRLLNSYLEPWLCQFPGTLATLKQIKAEWKVLSVLDLADGLWNIPVSKDLEPLFGMEAGGRGWTWQRLPQGWSASPGLFQSRMQNLFADLEGVVIYMDDLLLGTTTKEQHRDLLTEVLRRMDATGLRTNPAKAQVMKTWVKYLGFDVGEGKISLLRYAQEQSAKLPMVSSKREVRKMVGIMNVVRPCCQRLDEIVKELQALVSEQRKLPSVPELQSMVKHSWEQILSQTLKLNLLNPEEDLYLECDWSSGGKGFVLYCGRPEHGRIVAIGSKSHAENNLSSFLGEMRAIQWALEETKSFSAGRRIHLFTDSSSSAKRLCGTPGEKDLLDSRVARSWSWILENFILPRRLEIYHIPGISNSIADTLSRWKRTDEIGVAVSEGTELEGQIRAVHEKAHWGRDKVIMELQRRGIQASRAQVESILQQCRTCQAFRQRKPVDDLGEPPYEDLPGQVLFFDAIGPVVPGRGGLRYILNLVDSCTRLQMARGRKEITSSVVISFLEEWVQKHGPFKILVSDGASYNSSRQLGQWCSEGNVRQIWMAAYAHKSIGLIERGHRTVLDRLRRLKQEKGGSWSDHLEAAVLAINQSPHRTTGWSPSDLWRMGPEEWAAARQNSQELRDYHNQKLRTRNHQYHLGDQVWVWDSVRESRREDKFSPFWKGPYVVTERVSRTLWKVSTLTDKGTSRGRRPRMIVHSDHLQPFL